MVLPMDELIKLSREFSKPDGIYLSIADRYKIKNKIIRIENGLESKENYNEVIPYEIAKEGLLETSVVSTRVKHYTSNKETVPNTKVIDKYKAVVQNRIKEYIKSPVLTNKVKTFLK